MSDLELYHSKDNKITGLEQELNELKEDYKKYKAYSKATINNLKNARDEYKEAYTRAINKKDR